MSNNAVERYCKKVGKLLICTAETRRELLDGLRGELTELPPEKSDSVKKLEVYYGKITETAVSLQEAVPSDERASALARQKKIKITVCIAAAVVIIFLATLLYYLEIGKPNNTVVGKPIDFSTEASTDIPNDPPNK